MAPRNIARVDTTQHGCVLVARGIGAYVFLTHQMGHGFPDAVIAYRGRLLLVEFKAEKGERTEEQVKFAENMESRGVTVHVVRNPNEMLALLTLEEREEL